MKPIITKDRQTELDVKLNAVLGEMLGEDGCYVLIMGTEGGSDSHMISNVEEASAYEVICDIADAIRNNKASHKN